MVEDVNPFLTKLLAIPYENFVGQHIWNLGVFSDIAASKERFLTLQQREYVRYEDLPLETADGRHVNVEFVSNVYLVDRRKVIQCNIRDISERVRTAQALHESDERYRALTETTTDGFWVVDATGRLLEVNDAYCAMSGYSREQL
jgi:PAS domain S-box-containing protein